MAKDNTSIYMPTDMIPKSEIVSAVGAGDAFCAGTLYALHEGYTIEGLEDKVEDSYPLDNGICVNISGRADRIDRLADGSLQVIDYKSGNKEHLEYNGIATLFNGKPKERISNIKTSYLTSSSKQCFISDKNDSYTIISTSDSCKKRSISRIISS